MAILREFLLRGGVFTKDQIDAYVELEKIGAPAAPLLVDAAAGSDALAILRSMIPVSPTGPGQTAFTRIRSSACARARERVSIRSPAFAVE